MSGLLSFHEVIRKLSQANDGIDDFSDASSRENIA
jgi:hypothetical protein